MSSNSLSLFEGVITKNTKFTIVHDLGGDDSPYAFSCSVQSSSIGNNEKCKNIMYLSDVLINFLHQLTLRTNTATENVCVHACVCVCVCVYQTAFRPIFKNTANSCKVVRFVLEIR
jgi:hypothetical protein